MTELALHNPARIREAERFCQAILPSVSRTFAIGIRLLPGALGRAVLSGYLLCRIADTIEDEPGATAERKAARLELLLAALRAPALGARLPAELGELRGERDHVRLVRHADLVFALLGTLSERSRHSLQHWVGEMVRGMREIVLRHPQGVRIRTIEEYREYCYYVAGTVGYLLTELWHEHAGVSERRLPVLRERCRAFAEALQTVNILKDIARDAERGDTIYVPQEMLEAKGSGHALLLSPEHRAQNRSAIEPLMTLATDGLAAAREYVHALPRRALPVRLFCVLPVVYAHATLRELAATDAMFAPGGAIKISRREVRWLLAGATALSASNRGVDWLITRARSPR